MKITENTIFNDYQFLIKQYLFIFNLYVN